MNSAGTCPPPEKIDDLLTNRLSGAEAEELRQHLRDCPACRARLTNQVSEVTRYPFLSPPRAVGELGWLESFRILGVLGQGGMAVVFDAEDTRLNRRVALKVLRPDLSDELLRHRFLREAQLLASVSNEHIVPIYQVSEANGIPFIAMERLEGMSLAERLETDHWLPLAEALALAGQVADGLAVAHQHGLVHRDIKPANIWLESRNGKFVRVKLIDFGIARKVDQPSGLTRAGQVLGTPVYMAPEQAAGRPVDGRADLYSLGCVLYHMLTGQPPVGGEYPTRKLLREIVRGRVQVVREQTLQFPSAVAELIQQLLQTQPEQRPLSAAVVAQSLHRLEKETRLNSVPAAPAHAPPVIRRKRRANWVGILLGVVAVAASVVVGVMAAWSRLYPATEENKSPSDLPPLKVGILHSLSGMYAAQERPIVHALQLAVEEINKDGGVLDRQVEAIEEDGASDEQVFEQKARKLIKEDQVEVLFGCWTPSSRGRVAGVCQENNRLLFYAPSTEGLETSPVIVYLGGTPRQTAVPLVDWFHQQGKRRFFLLGSDTVYSHALHYILNHEITLLEAEVAGEVFVLPTEMDFTAVVDRIKKANADVILNTITGPANQKVLPELRKAGIRPPAVPTAWFTVSETELPLFPTIKELAGDYSVGCYFDSLDTPENRKFLKRFGARFHEQDRVNDDMQTAYASVYLWKKAVEQAGKPDTHVVRQALRGLGVEAPGGPIRIDPTTQYAYRTARIGQVQDRTPLPQFRIVYSSPKPLPPEPYPPWKTQPEWDQILKDLYERWGQRWERHR